MTRVAAQQQIVPELKKCHDLATSEDNDEFEFQILDDGKLLYRMISQAVQLFLPKQGGFCELLI